MLSKFTMTGVLGRPRSTFAAFVYVTIAFVFSYRLYASHHDLGGTAVSENGEPTYHHHGVPLSSDALNEDAFTSRVAMADANPLYETLETWRDPERKLVKADQSARIQSHKRSRNWSMGLSRIKMPDYSHYKSKNDYLRQPIMADYGQSGGASKIFFLLKTGGSELWNKLPIHFFTTLTKMKHFELYSDSPGSIAGHPIIDAFANMTEEFKKTAQDMEMYRLQKEVIHDQRAGFDYSETKLNAGWTMDKYKNIPIMMHAYLTAPEEVEWFFMMDADTYVMADTLQQWLDKNVPFSGKDKAAYFGSVTVLVSNQYLFAHGGSGILVSRKALDETIGPIVHDEVKRKQFLAKYERMADATCCGDALFGMMLGEESNKAITVSSGYEYCPGYKYDQGAANRPFQGNTIWDVDVTPDNWCTPLITFHHASVHDIEVLWEYERVGLGTSERRAHMTFGKLFKDFYLPQLKNGRLKDWDNNVLDEREGPKTVDECQALCEKEEYCLSYRFVGEESRCFISDSIKLGKKSHKHLQYDIGDQRRNNKGVVSGWLLKRFYDKIKCDKRKFDLPK
ncbi:hypothetical protein TRVA0_012S02806 [Trichomonascus vanleenenianus]|uniref:uncharacterized protein n=1 Tax=Trichomonascus vanleenenianus TaxID=2268995 RepID=UPI003ECA93E4